MENQRPLTKEDIVRMRLHNQQITHSRFTNPSDLVKWMGAVQAQDYPGAQWALGLRLPNSDQEEIEKAFSKGLILRTHVMRPTWHFVAPEDIRWLLALTAPRVNAVASHYYRKLGLDDKTFMRCEAILKRVLKGGKQLIRTELRTRLEKEGINTEGLRFVHLLMHAELEGVICSGARRGKQFTYTLLEERVPKAKLISRDEALATLTKRYFKSRGPASLHDFVWWSGLSMVDVKRGIELCNPGILQAHVEGKTYYFYEPKEPIKEIRNEVHLLPTYDEYGIAYKDRSAFSDTSRKRIPQSGAFDSLIILDGKMVGTWKRVIQKSAVQVHTKLLVELNSSEKEAIDKAIKRYTSFWKGIIEESTPQD